MSQAYMIVASFNIEMRSRPSSMASHVRMSSSNRSVRLIIKMHICPDEEVPSPYLAINGYRESQRKPQPDVGALLVRGTSFVADYLRPSTQAFSFWADPTLHE